MKHFFAILFALILIVSTTTFSQVPRKIHYQGVLTDQNGNPVNGTKSMEFDLFDVPAGGSPIFTQGAQNVQIKNGIFNVILGPIPLPFDVTYYLETIVEQLNLNPRVELGSAPYSIRAAHADSAHQADSSGHANNSDHASRSDSSHRSERADRSDRADQSDTTDFARAIADNTVTSVKILDASISLVDIGQNGAATGQVIKWNGNSWVPSNDEGSGGGGGSGWTDDGTNVRLSTSTDNVGIGTSSPSKKLEVSGSAKVTDTLFASNVSSNSPLRVQTAGTTRIFVADNGNVGIGTTSPLASLDVAGSIFSNGINSNSAIDTYGDFRLLRNGTFLIGTHNGIHFTGSEPVIGVNSSDRVSIGASFWDGVEIHAGTAERMRITPAGNIGIGTTSPTKKLDVVGSANVSDTLFTSNVSIGGGSAIKKVITATATLDFPVTLEEESSDLTISMAGAVLGDVVNLGVPNGSVMFATCYTAWVSAPDIVTVRFNNYSISDLDPASGVFRLVVTQF